MILVVGATGTNGREVVKVLSQRGATVRALVRDPNKAGDLKLPGVETVPGDLGDVTSLDAALRGIEKAFIVTAVDQRSPQWFRNFFDAAKRAKTQHIVKFSAMGAVHGTTEIPRQHGQSDQWLKETGIPYTILQPNSFFQNMLWAAPTIKDHGAFYLPLRDGRQSLIDVRDIAAVSAEVLTKPGHEGKTYELTGSESLSYRDVAEVLSKVLGKSVKYVDVPPSAAHEAMLKNGMPAWNAAAVNAFYGEFASGSYAYTTDAVQRITGKAPVTFEQFAREYASVFK